jgi:hypothetical protein
MKIETPVSRYQAISPEHRREINETLRLLEAYREADHPAYSELATPFYAALDALIKKRKSVPVKSEVPVSVSTKSDESVSVSTIDNSVTIKSDEPVSVPSNDEQDSLPTNLEHSSVPHDTNSVSHDTSSDLNVSSSVLANVPSSSVSDVSNIHPPIRRPSRCLGRHHDLYRRAYLEMNYSLLDPNEESGLSVPNCAMKDDEDDELHEQRLQLDRDDDNSHEHRLRLDCNGDNDHIRNKTCLVNASFNRNNYRVTCSSCQGPGQSCFLSAFPLPETRRSGGSVQ